MPLDLQVAYPQEIVPLDSVDRVPGSVPENLVVQGKDFRYVEEVQVNDSPAKFVTVSKTRMIVEVPEVLGVQELNTVTVLRRVLTITPNSRLRFRLRRNPSGVRGFLYLVQLFTKLLLTTPGRDIFSPRRGGGAQGFVGRTFSKLDSSAIVSDFVLAVDQVARQVQAAQAGRRNLSPDEILVAANVQQGTFDNSTGILTIAFELIPQSGRPGLVNLIT